MAELTNEEKYKKALKTMRGFHTAQSWTVEAIFRTIHKMIDEVIPPTAPHQETPPLPVSEASDPDINVLVNIVKE